MPEEPSTTTKAAALAARLSASTRLRQRRFELLPISGPGGVFTQVQGRMPGDSTSVEGLGDLIASIGEIGVLQPILVEHLPHGGYLLVAGERRLRACRIGAIDDPSNPHFQSIPAVVCPGPLTVDERATWQLVENLARADLQPGELGAALAFERCALLQVRLEQAGFPPPPDALAHDDPVARWSALEDFRIRSDLHSIGASWADVLKRLGLPLRPEKAHQIWRALKELPAEISEQMDEQEISLNARTAYLRLVRTKADDANELWTAVRTTQRGRLLAGAIQEKLSHPDLSVDDALARVEERHVAANEARAQKARRPDGNEAGPAAVEVPAETTRAAIEALSTLAKALRAGQSVPRFDAGSLRLYVTEVVDLLDRATDPGDDSHDSDSDQMASPTEAA